MRQPGSGMRPRLGALLIWGGLVLALGLPLGIAASNPLMGWRQPVYVAACLAGVLGLWLLLVQPLLATGLLPGLRGSRGRWMHRLCGVLLLAAVALHLGGLWLTSPPDMVDALLLRAPTLFSVFGVLGLWALLAAALLVAARQRLPARLWRPGHRLAVAVVGLCVVPHALLIEGSMGPVSKAGLCVLVLVALGFGLGRGLGRRRITRP